MSFLNRARANVDRQIVVLVLGPFAIADHSGQDGQVDRGSPADTMDRRSPNRRRRPELRTTTDTERRGTAVPGGNFFNLDENGTGSINTIKFTLPGHVPYRYLDSLRAPAPQAAHAFTFLGYQTIFGQPTANTINFEDNVMSRNDLKVIGTLDVTCTYTDSTLSGAATCTFTLTLTNRPLLTGNVVVPADGGTVIGTFSTASGRHGTVVSNTLDPTSSAHPNFEGLALVATLHFGGHSR
jgi:hypothetical protein